MSREELRVSIIIKGDRILLGAQATDCDPKMATLQGDLQTALERVPSFIEEANQQWDTAPHNPKSTIPEPVAPPPPRVATPSTKQPTAVAAKVKAQPKFF